MRKLLVLTAALLCTSFSYAVKQHVVTFGKLMPVKLFLGPSEDRVTDMQVRSLFIDGKLKDFTTGDTHDITDTVFVVRERGMPPRGNLIPPMPHGQVAGARKLSVGQMSQVNVATGERNGFSKRMKYVKVPRAITPVLPTPIPGTTRDRQAMDNCDAFFRGDRRPAAGRGDGPARAAGWR